MSFIADKPYNDLPLLPPDSEQWETIEIYKQLAKARAALAELKGRAPVIPNPKMLINTLVLEEAKDSSSIENVFTSTDKLYRAFSSSSVEPDPQTKEVLRYRYALWNTWQRAKKEGLSLNLMEEIYKTIKDDKDGIRDSEVYIGSQYSVIYTPPVGKELLEKKLENWIDFANSKDGIDPLIKMAILHYQFEAIHPFVDGNGRTGRILNVLFITLEQLLDQPILYLSKYINKNKNDYYRLLREVTEKENLTDWILYILFGITETAVFTLNKINAIHDLFTETLEKVKTQKPKIYKYELVEMLFSQPYCKIAFLVEAGIASRNTASKYLSELADLKILKPEKSGNETLFLNIELLKLLSKG